MPGLLVLSANARTPWESQESCDDYFTMSVFCQRFQWPFVKLKELLSIKYTLLKLISKKFVTPNNFFLFLN